MIATATAFTAESIADAYRRFVFPRIKPATLPKLQIILGGGGAKNPTLVRMMAAAVGRVTPCAPRMGLVNGATGVTRPTSADSGVAILTHEDFGMDSSAKEPLAFAIMAHETLLGRPGNVPSVTGARRAVVLGKIVPSGAA